MNEQVIRSALKLLKNFISPDQIKAIVHEMINKAIDYKQKIVLNADQDETTVSAIIYEVNGLVYFAIAVFTPENRITRFENVTLLDDLIDSLINKL
jgi:hypothetical protein